MAKNKFNWKLTFIALIFLTVLSVTAVGLRKWQRNRMAYNARQTGLIAYKARQWDQAAKYLGRYLAVNRHDVEIFFKYAQAQLNIRPLKRGNMQQAIATYRAILRTDKDSRSATENLITLYMQINAPAEAELIATRYLSKNKDPIINTMLAISFAEQRKFDQAKKQFEFIIKDYPNHVIAYQAFSQFAKEHPKALETDPEHLLNQAVRNNPLSAIALIIRAQFYLDTGLSSQAMADLENAEKLDLSDLTVRLRLIDQFTNANMFDKAREYLNNVYKDDPANQQLWQRWAMLGLKTNSKREMLEAARTGLQELYPDVWDFMPFAAELFIKCQEFKYADQCIQRLKRKDMLPATVAFLEGFLAQAQNQTHKAILLWQRAQQLGDNSEKIHLALARAYYRVGDTKSSVQQLQIFVSQQPSLYRGHFELAKVLSQTHNWAEAVEHARIARQIGPDNVTAAMLESQAQMQLLQINDTDSNDPVWKNIEKQLFQLDISIDGAVIIKLLQFQLAMQRGQIIEAEQLLANLKAVQNQRLDVGLARIDLLIAKAQIETAISKLYELTEQYPQNPLPTKYLATLLAKHDKGDDCEKLLKKALIDIDDPVAKRSLGLLMAYFYDQWNQNDKAANLLLKLSQELPRDVPVKRRLLKNKIITKDIDQAQRIIDDIKALEGDMGWKWRYEQAYLWFTGEEFKEKYSQIITLLKHNLNNCPSDQASRMLLGAAYEKADELQLAISTYREALDRSWDNIHIIVAAASAMLKAREYEQADEILNRAVMEKLSHPQMSRLELISMLRQGKLSSAEAILKNLTAQDPNNHTALLSLAILKMRQNKNAQARALLNELKAFQQNSIAVTAALVELDVRQKRTRHALSLCNEVLQQSGDASAYILRGKTYMMIGENELARKDFVTATLIEPDNIRSWVAKSNFNRSAGRLKEAVKDMETAMALEPENLRIKKQIIALLLSSGQDDNISRSWQLLRDAMELYPNDIELKLCKAHYLLTEETAPSIELAQQVLQAITCKQPKYCAAWALLAKTHLMNKQSGKALDIILQGLTYSPNDKDLLLLKAHIEAQRSPLLAIGTLRILNEREPNNCEIALELANMYIASRQYDNAVTLLHNLLSSCQEKDRRKIDTSLAVAMHKNGNISQSQQIFDSLYKSIANDSQVFLAQIKLLIDQKNWQQSHLRVSRWLKQNPDDIETFIAIVRNLTETRNKQALDSAENLLTTILEHDHDSLKALNSMVMLLQITGRYSESVTFYERILEIKPDDLVALNNLAWIMCEEQGKCQLALELTKRGLQKAPMYVDLIDTHGVIYYRLGDYQNAVSNFQKCIQLYPENSSAMLISQFHLARTLIALGKNDKAIYNLKKTLQLSETVQGLSKEQLTQAKDLLTQLLEEKEHDYSID